MAFNKEKSEINIEVLTNDLKLVRVSSFVIFKNDKVLVLSPTIQALGGYFDVNFNTISEMKNLSKKAEIKLIIIRYFDKLLVGDLDNFLTELTDLDYVYSPPGNQRLKKWQYSVKEKGSMYFVSGKGSKKVKLIEMNKELLTQYVQKGLNGSVTIISENKNKDTKLNDVNSLHLISIIFEYIQSKGFYYSFESIKNLYLSLRSKPFVIISGISGTGKTKIVQLFAESIGATDENGQFKLIPVRPDWSDSSELLGYVDLKGDFQRGPLTEMVEHAMDHPNLPHFILLDEMNLARVEYYFSDVLSVMESRKRDGDQITSSPLLDKKYMGRTIKLPENLYIIGTVNMDETTHPFSKKVLDRANTIEFNEVYLNRFDFLEDLEDVEAQRISNEQLKPSFISLKDIWIEQKALVEKVSQKLADINGYLELINAHVGYRVRDEICFYMVHNENAELLEEHEAFDFCVMQKILPRITGSDGRIDKLLGDLFIYMTGVPYVADSIQESKEYPRSAKKVAEMLRRYHTDGFTSFWIS